MKKLLFAAISILILATCSSDKTDGDIIINHPNQKLPSTAVFVQGNLVNYTSTRADYGYGTDWPKVNEEEGWEAAKFSIRIDGTFPGVVDQNVSKYWSKRGGPNLGKVYTAYPWGMYQDRNYGMFRYVLDPFGTQVNAALMEVPDIKAYLEWCLEQDDVQLKTELKYALDHWDEYEVIWYVAKEVQIQHLWHVNGYLKKKSYDPKDIWDIIIDETDDMEVKDNDVADNVEIDVHKQEHNDWNEIKTSIHVRTDAKSVKINIPITFDNIVEADDFAIRIYNYYISGIEIENMITHDENGITINITNIDPEVIEKLKTKFGDGLTIEVHSYCKREEGIWEAMKKTTVVTGKDCNLKYQITSADEEENKTKVVVEHIVTSE
ncbi:MAG: hypothetical protein J5770_05560 [Bacteroidaceae bacterium]|nr:hypothetical protein [Bacteroidaceae bacterium]